ncbi:MAG: hypothetical protein K0Q50_32 [Vampirovibrio sp.]|jgi:hypothetical protein|nr:hypothetical protein [Vampirovibrio sp.]
MRIDSGTQSIQLLKAQQAWEARRASKTNANEQTAPASPSASPAIEVARPTLDSTPSVSQAVAPQWAQKVQEIQQVAEKAGFVGVSEQDIRRAYVHGESLFADYRV